MLVLNKEGFGHGSVCIPMGDAASELGDLGFLTEKSRPVGTVLMCEMLLSVKLNMCLGVTLNWRVSFAVVSFPVCKIGLITLS